MNNSFAFDLEVARSMADSFASTVGVRCRLLSARGDMLYQSGAPGDECGYLRSLPAPPPPCEDLHLRGIRQAEQLGGRYIYSCASGLTYCASPIVVGGALVGGLIAGPVLLVETEDLLEELAERRGVPCCEVDVLRVFLSDIPRSPPDKMSWLSLQLFANAICIGDNSRELIFKQGGRLQQRAIGQYVHQVKSGSRGRRYPIEKEQELFNAVTRGDRNTGNALLNELLGHIFFFTSDADTAQNRIAELLWVLSRAAIHGGGSPDAVLAISDQYVQQLRHLRSQEETAQWLAQVLHHYTDLVFNLVDSKHRNVIRKAMSYMQLNCERNLTLGEVADYVGYSHTHFSKVFKEEIGCGFRSYLNQVRVEKSKALLLADNAPMAEIYSACGFEDQSYFCKVFKQLVGVTPDRYRKQDRRLGQSKELDSGQA